MTFRNLMATTSAVVLLAAAPAMAQMYEGYDSTLGYDGFHTGFTDSGYYDAWDSDDSMSLTENEFATGVYSDWDRDNDGLISEEEYGLGANRWYGDDYDTAFTDYDADASGFIDQSEFGSNWDNEYYTGWDSDGDSELSDTEYSRGVYGLADRDQDTVISIEEEGWFEGWFDGDDVEAEIEQVGDVL
ncbi:hypothetical protein OCGS_1879 [Oceaniovalibus guishaninsula JLT2003]|uniref:EF-hand domain-containing protein n=1 Tax=Oceaniovalibus guishaninsula JLT2003 TaxID=1231392 RepID=K2H8I0_9RHOB|nr:hypothetical protein [Oceaniovalibus guishaninsula]EKE43898.1 hypothetical protein OCGS_1879 [Oceaniovalibus guishaninsula JLT2003]